MKINYYDINCTVLETGDEKQEEEELDSKIKKLYESVIFLDFARRDHVILM